mgnify:CR=1 FL=1
MRSEDDRSDMNSEMLIDLTRRKECETWGRGGGTGMSSVDRRAKWSEGVDGRQVTVGGVEVFSGVINKSRMLPLV